MHATNFLYASFYNVAILFVFIAFIIKASQLYIQMKRRDARESDNSPRLMMLLLLSGAMILMGCLGYFGELAAPPCSGAILPGGSFVTVIATVVNSADQAGVIADCFSRSASTMLTGLLAAAISALIWLFLQNKSAH